MQQRESVVNKKTPVQKLNVNGPHVVTAIEQTNHQSTFSLLS